LFRHGLGRFFTAPAAVHEVDTGLYRIGAVHSLLADVRVRLERDEDARVIGELPARSYQLHPATRQRSASRDETNGIARTGTTVLFRALCSALERGSAAPRAEVILGCLFSTRCTTASALSAAG